MRLRIGLVAATTLALTLGGAGFVPGPAAAGEIPAAQQILALKRQSTSYEALLRRRLDECSEIRARRAARAAAASLQASPSEAPSASNPRTSFASNVRVNDPAGDLFSDEGQAGPSVAASGAHAVMVWRDGRGLDAPSPDDQVIGYGYSSDGGASWTDGGSLPRPPGLPNWMWFDFPHVVVNESTGEFWAVGFAYPDSLPTAGTTNAIAIVRGTFTGDTFSWDPPQVVVSYLLSQAVLDRPWLAVDPASGALYVSYTRTTPFAEDIRFQSSTNSGASWSFPSPLTTAGDDVQGSRVAVGPSGEVYVVWQSLGSIDRDLYKIRKSVDGGASFSPEVVAAFEVTNPGSEAPGSDALVATSYPRIAVDRTSSPYRGRVYLCWSETVDYFALDLTSASTGNISEPEGVGISGQDDNATRAVAFTVGNRVRGAIADIFNDVDWYKFTATFGQTVVFSVDSLSSGLDMDFRIFCGDSTTKLALSSPGKGQHNLIVWSAPATGTYYLRCAAWPLRSDVGPHRYRIHTAFHTDPGDDRGRDTRDVFVVSSPDGVTWATTGPNGPLRVNDDLGRYDDWRPEIAVTSGGRLVCTWYDWRDANPDKCAGQSNLYLYRSENAGVTWTNLGLLTDATSDWTTASTNLTPKQGDQLALYGADGSVYVAWTDARDGNPNIYSLPIDIATATEASLASSQVTPGRVVLDWYAAGRANQPATLERRDPGGGWGAIDHAIVGGDGSLRFVDTGVTGGRTYGYRLAFADGPLTLYSTEAEIFVPSSFDLALAAPRPNPASGPLWFSVTLPDAAPARLTLVDVAGRRIASREVGPLGTGVHRVTLAEGSVLPPGLYLARLERAGRVLTARVTLVR